MVNLLNKVFAKLFGLVLLFIIGFVLGNVAEVIGQEYIEEELRNNSRHDYGRTNFYYKHGFN